MHITVQDDGMVYLQVLVSQWWVWGSHPVRETLSTMQQYATLVGLDPSIITRDVWCLLVSHH